MPQTVRETRVAMLRHGQGFGLQSQRRSRLYIAGKSLTRGPLYGPSAARADGRRTKFDWREVRTMNSWSHLMQQHAAHGVRAQSSQLQTRPGLWPPAPEVKPKATSGVLSPVTGGACRLSANPTQTPKRPLRASPDPGRHRSNPDRDRRPFRVGGRVPPSSGD